MAVPGHKGKLEASGAATAMSEEACSVISGTSNAHWKIDDAAKDVFDWTAVVTVEISEDSGSNWYTLGAEEFTLRYLTGIVEIDAYTTQSGVVANITNVRVSGNYLPKIEVAGARSAEFEIIAAMSIVSRLGDNGERRQPVREDASVSFEDLVAGDVPLDGAGGSEDALYTILRSGTAVVASITPNRDTATESLRFLIKLESDSISIPGGDVSSGSFSAVATVQDSAMATQKVRSWDFKT